MSEFDKYRAAADTVQDALRDVVAACIPGAKVADLCKLGNQAILRGCNSVFSKGKNKVDYKGLSFPTTISLNNVICHFAPLDSDPEAATALTAGDVVKIELGAHVDGYIAQVAHTVVVSASISNKIIGRKADVLLAAYYATEAALRTIKVGNTNWQVTDVIQTVSQEFDCLPIEGMLSHQIARNVLDGEKIIVLNPSKSQRNDIETVVFEVGEAYTLDILISTGQGKSKTSDSRTTVYKRNPDESYQVKMKTSRATLAEVNQKFGPMAFNLGQFEDVGKARMGIVECVRHGLLIPYPVLEEKEEDSIVAHIMVTVLLTASGTSQLTKIPWSPEFIQTEKKISDPELIELLKQDIKPSKK